jgi:hypothetical protein
VRKPLATSLLLAWAVVMAIQCARSVKEAFVVPGSGWKVLWTGISMFYAVVAYGTYRAFSSIHKSKNAN